MRDIIWTVIIVWVVWKIYDAFKNVSKPKTQTHGYSSRQHTNFHSQKKEGEVKIDPTATKSKSHFKPEDGEYVDYEEVK